VEEGAIAAMFLFGLSEGKFGIDPLLLMLVALAVDAYVGELTLVFRFVPHPLAIVARITRFLERKLNRETRSQADRAVRGGLVVLFLAVAAGAVGWGLRWLAVNLHYGWVLELVLLIPLVAQRGPFDRARAVASALTTQGLDAARAALAGTQGRDPAQLDAHGAARTAIERMAEAFNDSVVAPVFWYVLFGLPGLLVYRAVNVADGIVGHRTERFRAFGLAAARLDDVLNLIPARLAGLFMALGALFVPTARPLGAVTTMLRDAGKHRSPNVGWPQAAMAGALDVALAGPRRLRAETVVEPWIGDGRAKATANDIRRALYLFVAACLVNALFVASLALVRLG
jgi:adenosylcobinamide-phosphate synthase